MPVLGTVLVGLGKVLDLVLQIYMFVLFGRAIIAWVNADPRNGIVRVLRAATDPPVEFIRRRLPRNLRSYPLDIAFLVVLGLVLLGRYAVANSLVDLGLRLNTPVAGHGLEPRRPFVRPLPREALADG
jgi:YggT family protein